MTRRKNPEPILAICVDNTDYEMSLERRKIYAVASDMDAEQNDLLRIIDETGEDYLFPASRFVLIAVPRQVEKAVLAA